VAVQPALRTLREAPAQLDALDAQLQGMQRQAADVARLKGISPVGAAQAAEALKAATARLGDKAKLSLQGDRAVVTFNNVTSTELRSWLGEARSGARARPAEAQLTKGPKGYSGPVTLTLVGGN
jgi:general secretion pathway protein M